MTTPQSSYIGHHSELYDLFYADKPYSDEVAFVHHCIQTWKPSAFNILELACGTGSHALVLENYGYKIIATDYSSDMLARATEKAKKQKSQVDFRKQDMRMLNVPERPFDAILCLFDSIGYVDTNENILRVLDCVHSHLAPDGIFIFEFWHAGAMLRNYERLRIRRWQTSQGNIERISETHMDYEKQHCHVSYTINELNADGTYHSLHETQINRFFLVQEMSFFLSQSGLSPLRWFAGFREDEQIGADTWHIVAVARKGMKP